VKAITYFSVIKIVIQRIAPTAVIQSSIASS